MKLSSKKKAKLAKLDQEEMNREPGALSGWELCWWVVLLLSMFSLLFLIDNYLSKSAFVCYFFIALAALLYDDPMRRRLVKWFGI